MEQYDLLEYIREYGFQATYEKLIKSGVVRFHPPKHSRLEEAAEKEKEQILEEVSMN